MNKLLAIVLASLAVLVPLTSEAGSPDVQIQLIAPLPFLPPVPVVVQGPSQHWNDRGSSHGYYHAPRGYAGQGNQGNHYGHRGHYYQDYPRHHYGHRGHYYHDYYHDYPRHHYGHPRHHGYHRHHDHGHRGGR